MSFLKELRGGGPPTRSINFYTFPLTVYRLLFGKEYGNGQSFRFREEIASRSRKMCIEVAFGLMSGNLSIFV